MKEYKYIIVKARASGKTVLKELIEKGGLVEDMPKINKRLKDIIGDQKVTIELL
jgi:hypothetical protein